MRAALDALYLSHAPLLFALCVRIVRNRPEAEEVLQEVFWEVWRSGGRFAAERGQPARVPAAARAQPGALRACACAGAATVCSPTRAD